MSRSKTTRSNTPRCRAAIQTVAIFVTLAALAPAPPGRAATITVDTVSGAAGGNVADCTLRDAITAANTDAAVDGCVAGSGPDEIVFAPALAGLTITLAEQDNFWYGPNALPPIYSDVTIDGGDDGITIERDAAALKMRFFYVAGSLHAVPDVDNGISPGALTLRRLTLTGGLARGGDSGAGGAGAGLGGAIYNQGTLVLDRILAVANTAEGGSAEVVAGAGGGGLGGDGGGGGGGFRESGGDSDGGDFLGGEGGSADGSGGTGGTSTIGGDGTDGGLSGGGDGGGFAPNSFDGGGVGDESTIGSGGGGFGGGGGGGVGGSGGGGGVGGGGGGGSGLPDPGSGGGFGGGGSGPGGDGGFGGGGGEASGGGGGFGGGGGSAGSGGAYGGAGGTTGSSIQGGGGGAGLGGVVFNHFGAVTITNSTLTINAAQGGDGGGGAGEFGGGGGAGLGGAIFNLDGTVSIESSTLAGNRAAGGLGGGESGEDGEGRGGAIFNHFQDDGVGNTIAETTAATIVLEDSILADSIDAAEDCFDNATASVTLQGNNLIEANAADPNACGSPTSSDDPLLGPLQDNGGPTQTLALLAGSPALDAADDATCPPPASDQRGAPRPVDFGGGLHCDLGAYEQLVSHLAIAGVTATEGTGGATTFDFAVSRDIDLGTASVQVDTADGSASAPADYAAVAGLVVSFAAGETLKIVAVSIVTDAIVEPDETFSVVLSNPSADALIDTGIATGTILDDDALLASSLTATKSVAGTFVVGETITYTIVLTNPGPGAQADSAGDELVDVVPPELLLIDAFADTGTVVADVPSNTVTWNGALAAGASATITIEAEVLAAAAGQTVSNQATVSFDSDNDASHDASAPSDDPTAPGADDPTLFGVAAPALEIPVLDPRGLVLLALILAAVAAWRLRG